MNGTTWRDLTMKLLEAARRYQDATSDSSQHSAETARARLVFAMDIAGVQALSSILDWRESLEYVEGPQHHVKSTR